MLLNCLNILVPLMMSDVRNDDQIQPVTGFICSFQAESVMNVNILFFHDGRGGCAVFSKETKHCSLPRDKSFISR